MKVSLPSEPQTNNRHNTLKKRLVPSVELKSKFQKSPVRPAPQSQIAISSQVNPKNDHYYPKSNPEIPRWVMVDVEIATPFSSIISLYSLRENPKLKEMPLLTKRKSFIDHPCFKTPVGGHSENGFVGLIFNYRESICHRITLLKIKLITPKMIMAITIATIVKRISKYSVQLLKLDEMIHAPAIVGKKIKILFGPLAGASI